MSNPRAPMHEVGTLNLSPRTRVGAYEIVSMLGAGGMGEVYRARDTRLDRTVALKLLSRQLAAEARRRQRFEREARAISRLNHPHICTLHDVGEATIVTPHVTTPSPSHAVVPYLVMECLEGQTLAERLARGRLPVEEVLQYAVQIADALGAAHRHGIVHRDLKPSNIMLTKTGAKLLDFGVARMTASGDDDHLQSAALTASGPATLTGEGSMVGTTPYMSPEQLEGRDADARSDLFAFGAVLYEMLTGRRAFAGDSEAAVIAAVLDSSPPPISASIPLPAALEHLVATCLAKDPEDRWQNAADVKRQVEWIAANVHAATSATLVPSNSRRWFWPMMAVTGVSLFAAGMSYLMRMPDAAEVVRFALSAPHSRTGQQEPGFSLSPDGSRLAFVAPGPGGEDAVWVRRLDRLEPQALSGTEGAYSPFWSPDGGSIAYFAHGKLMRVPVAGGRPQVLSDVSTPAVAPAGAWSSTGWIVFAQAFGPLHRVSALGGDVSPVTSLNAGRQEFGHYTPHFLPDGEHFLYVGNSSRGPTGIHVGSLTRQESQLLLKTTASGAAFSDGFLLFVEEGYLKAQKLDAARLQLTGKSVPVGEATTFSAVAGKGTLAYRVPDQTLTQLGWFDRTGNRLGTVGSPGYISAPALSPDETKIAVGRDGDIWVIDIVRGNETRLTSDPNFSESWPIWSPDGQYIVYSRSSGSGQLVRKHSAGGGTDEVVLDASGIPYEWSVDGRFITYFAAGNDTQADLYLAPMSGDRNPLKFLQTKFQEVAPRLSPDGKFMAYASNESGRLEVYVQTFPATDNRWLISTAGGAQPIWRRDGKELFYLAADGTLMAVEIATTPTFTAGVPRSLFKTNSPQGPVRNSYAPSQDGQRFLVNSYVEDGTSSIVVLVNWPAMISN